MIVINLFAGPGVGKSTTRALIFAHCKIAGIKIEETTEYAKDLQYEERFDILADQLYVLAKQNRKLERLKNKVDCVISDSPILLGIAYKPLEYLSTNFNALAFELFNTYTNINFFLERDTNEANYQTYGRSQTYNEAVILDNQIKSLLTDNKIPYISIPYENRIKHILYTLKYLNKYDCMFDKIDVRDL